MRYILISLLVFMTSNSNAQSCQPTETMHSGTHYQTVTRQQVDLGRGLVVSGVVRSSRDCKPIANAKISHWQTGTDGVYADRFYAYMFSDAQGHYRYHTEWPGATIPHIHFIVEAPEHKTLTTQWIGDDKTAQISFDLVLEAQP